MASRSTAPPARRSYSSRDPRQGGLPDSPAHKRDPNRCALQFFPKLCGEQGACLRSMPVKPERSEACGSSIQQLVVLADEAESAERKRLEIGAGREQGRCLLFDAAAVTERRERVEPGGERDETERAANDVVTGACRRHCDELGDPVEVGTGERHPNPRRVEDMAETFECNLLGALLECLRACGIAGVCSRGCADEQRTRVANAGRSRVG